MDAMTGLYLVWLLFALAVYAGILGLGGLIVWGGILAVRWIREWWATRQAARAELDERTDLVARRGMKYGAKRGWLP